MFRSNLFKTAPRICAATTVLCFGDSWTYGNAYGLQQQLKRHGHTDVKVVNKDFWGSTAEYFAKNPNLLPSEVSAHNADFVLLSMGGNDFKNIYWRNKQCVTPWTAVDTIEKHLVVVLDKLFEQHPNVKVVTYGYDFPGCIENLLTGRMWDSSKQLSSYDKALLWAYKTIGVRFINYSATQLGHALAKLSKQYSEKGFSFTYVPLWGSLQSAAEGKSDVAPVWGMPSPDKYMEDPIHANSQGYTILLGNLYTAYFHKVLSTASSTSNTEASAVTTVS